MKKMKLMMGMMLVSVCAMAQGVVPPITGDVVINVTTFAGMMAVVTMIVTQMSKRIAYIAAHKWAKVLTALGVGVVSTMACWALQVSDYLQGLNWWQALIAGVAVGLSSAGFYDVIKALWEIFKPKNDEVIHLD